jgi:hypothetical protein
MLDVTRAAPAIFQMRTAVPGALIMTLEQKNAPPTWRTRAHSVGRFYRRTLLKAHTQNPCFFYRRPEHAFHSARSAYLLSIGGVGINQMLGLLYRLPAYDRVKMLRVYSLIVGLKGNSPFSV